MHGKVVYIRPKAIRPFLRLCTSGSYVHRAAQRDTDILKYINEMLIPMTLSLRHIKNIQPIEIGN
jgi:hypothetical protein